MIDGLKIGDKVSFTGSGASQHGTVVGIGRKNVTLQYVTRAAWDYARTYGTIPTVKRRAYPHAAFIRTTDGRWLVHYYAAGQQDG